MNATIAVLKVETQRDSYTGDDSDVTELFKIEEPVMTEADADEDLGILLFQYNNHGYGYLESLNTDDPDEAIERAEERVPDYCDAIDAEIVEINVERRN